MSTLELNSQEAGILHRILESYMAELRTEMAVTTMEGLTDLLALEAELIARLLPQLEQQQSMGPSGAPGEYV
jgi:hypothetical protein